MGLQEDVNTLKNHVTRTQDLKVLDAVLDLFRRKLYLAMCEAYDAGKTGWDDPEQAIYLYSRLLDAISDNDWVSVGNYAMMLDNLEAEFQNEDDLNSEGEEPNRVVAPDGRPDGGIVLTNNE